MDNLSRFNRVRYKMYGNTIDGYLLIDEPGNWDDDGKELIRSEKFFGVNANLTNSNLEFYGKAFSQLKYEYDLNGIKAEVKLEREVRNDNTDKWELSYSSYFDFSTYVQEKNYIKIKMHESKFFKTIESRFKDQFELERLTDLKGNPIPPLNYKTLELQGREIFRKTEFNNTENYFMYKAETEFVVDAFYFPLKLLYKSDENVFQQAIGVNTSGQIDNQTAFVGAFGASIGQFFYITADNENEITIKVKGDVKFQNYGATNNIKFRFARYLYDENTGILSDSIFEDLTPEFSISPSDGLVTKTIDFESTFNKRINDSFAIIGTWAGSIYPLRIDYQNFNVTLEEIQDSVTTTCDCLTYYQAFERLFLIITGQNSFSSSLLSGFWKDLLLTNGFKIRNIPDKSITISLEELYNDLNSKDDISLIIQNNSIRIEYKDFVFDRTDSINIGKVFNIVRKIEEKLHYSTIEIGSDFNGIYEEVVGLDEPNIKTSYTTCLDEIDNKFSTVSKVRSDSYGITLAQTKQYLNFPKLDTKYDKYNFSIDAIQENQFLYTVRHWPLDFVSEPTGIYSPDTAFNLRLSPFNSLLRKGKTISTGLQKYLNERLVYSSTEGNSQLVTIYPERANILNSVLDSPYFLPESISFNKKISMIEFNNIVNNPFKLIKFENEFGKDEYGFIYPSVKPNNEGNWILIKANI